MAEIKIKIADPLAQHLADAVERRIDLESWRNRERARAIAEGDAAKLVRADLIMKRARRSARLNVTKVAR